MQHFELEAREAVRDLVARYNQYGDAGRIDALLELFCEDAVLEVAGIARYAGKQRIRALFTESRTDADAREQAPGPLTRQAPMLRHFIATHQIDIESEHAASGRCYYAVLDEQGIDHFGRYKDRYLHSAAGWRFSARKVYVDMTRPGGYAERNLQRLREAPP